MDINRRLVLASNSPRRRYLLREVGFQFTCEIPDVEEVYPDALPLDQVARYLASIKAESFRPKIYDEILLTADTVVILNNRILNKPKDRDEGISMLTSLSGRTHKVMTGVSILSKEKEETFDETTFVTFNELSRDDIEFYIDQFKPYDKAGAYGAQDCLPPGINPCSPEEIQFLETISRPDLIDQTITPNLSGKNVVIIKKIEGSYFNVMGFPIHKIYGHLMSW
jgi:septum formation protein